MRQSCQTSADSLAPVNGSYHLSDMILNPFHCNCSIHYLHFYLDWTLSEGRDAVCLFHYYICSVWHTEAFSNYLLMKGVLTLVCLYEMVYLEC